MKILLPESIQDITLSQYQRYDKLNKRLEEEDITVIEYNKRKITMFSGIPYHKIDNVQHTDLESVMEQIDIAINQDAEFIQRFKIGDQEFGFIPNFDAITSAEYFDLNKYGVEIDTLHNLMAILFRPITKEDSFKNYNIGTYNGTSEYAEVMKNTPMNIVNGAIVFFCNLSSELENYILKFTMVEQAKAEQQQTTLVNGDGTQLSTN